jgi:N-acetyl-anhydromuramoyl-L-alanine amidase
MIATGIPDSELEIDADGWCHQAVVLPSPNFDARSPASASIDLLVIHNISLPPGQFGGPFIADLFCNSLNYTLDPYFEQLQQLRVSAHFLIRRDGALLQFVSVNHRAWHAGTSSFGGRLACNDFSIGVELEGTDFEAFTSVQYAVLARLTRGLRKRYPVTDVAGHEHIAPVRKTDPGPFFDWSLYQQMVEAVAAETALPALLRFPSRR